MQSGHLFSFAIFLKDNSVFIDMEPVDPAQCVPTTGGRQPGTGNVCSYYDYVKNFLVDHNFVILVLINKNIVLLVSFCIK